MSRAFCLLMGKGKDELEEMLKDVEAKLEKAPEDEELLAEKEEILKLLDQED